MNYLRVKDIAKISRGASPRPIDNPLFFDDDNGEFSWVRISDVTSSNKYLLKTDEKLSDLGSKLSVKLIKPTLFLSIAGSVGKPCINKIKACIHDGFIYLKKPKYNINYLYWFFNNSSIYEGKGKVGTQLNLNSETVGGLFIPNITLSQQKAIANYLDHQTSKIDNEISLLEKKVEMLTEYKQALIFETVTKGLDKNVKMKDSGIEWIGMIPEHWEVRRVKELFKIGRGRVIAVSDVEEEQDEKYKYPVYSAATDNNGIIGYIKKYDFINDLLTWTTDGAKAGTVFIRNGKFNCTNVCGTLISKSSKYNLEFQKYALEVQTPYYKRSDINGAKIMNNEMAKILLVQPTNKNEQKKIANYLNIECNKIDKKKEIIKNKIELMKEYKQSLIYECVTGKREIL